MKAIVSAVLSPTCRNFLALAGVIGGCILAIRHQMVQATPPSSVTTIEEFREIMDDGDYGWGCFRKDSKFYYEARKSMPVYLLPSGPACYVFDGTGQFVDWTSDNGDDSAWDREWGQTGRVEMTFEEIKAEIGARDTSLHGKAEPPKPRAKPF